MRAAASRAHRHLVSPADWLRVIRVHNCEEAGNWRVHGPVYFGGIGWRAATWSAYRAAWMPARMDRATPEEQAWAMVRFVRNVLGYWPDQNWPSSCSGGY